MFEMFKTRHFKTWLKTWLKTFQLGASVGFSCGIRRRLLGFDHVILPPAALGAEVVGVAPPAAMWSPAVSAGSATSAMAGRGKGWLGMKNRGFWGIFVDFGVFWMEKTCWEKMKDKNNFKCMIKYYVLKIYLRYDWDDNLTLIWFFCHQTTRSPLNMLWFLQTSSLHAIWDTMNWCFVQDGFSTNCPGASGSCQPLWHWRKCLLYYYCAAIGFAWLLLCAVNMFHMFQALRVLSSTQTWHFHGFFYIFHIMIFMDFHLDFPLNLALHPSKSHQIRTLFGTKFAALP